MNFPLHGGTFYVAQGGDAFWLNRHHMSKSQRFALDIVALNWLGARAWGIYPAALEAYAIYGETVYSPCSGTVTAARSTETAGLSSGTFALSTGRAEIGFSARISSTAFSTFSGCGGSEG